MLEGVGEVKVEMTLRNIFSLKIQNFEATSFSSVCQIGNFFIAYTGLAFFFNTKEKKCFIDIEGVILVLY